MNGLKKTVAILTFLATGFLFTVTGKELDTMPSRFLAERALGGLKVKVADNFTIGCWSALYWGTSYFPSRFRFEPFTYQGFDIVPGFVADLGKVIGNTKLSLGGDLYYLWRNWEFDDEPSLTHYRQRANVIFSVPFAGNFNMTVIQRFERITHQRWMRVKDTVTKNYTGPFLTNDAPSCSYFRYRTTFKLSTPPFTSLKISPYALYEGFIHPIDYFYYEAEFGFSMSPAKGWSISLAEQIQSTPQQPNWETHQISFYIFYTLDFSKQIAEMTKSAR